MEQTFFDLLSRLNLPSWVFVGGGMFYLFSTSRWAEKLPGALGSLARSFNDRALDAAKREREEANVSSGHYEDELRRMDGLLERVNHRLDDAFVRIETLEEENRRVRGALASAVGFIHELLNELRAMGIDRKKQIPREIREYFNEWEDST